MNALTARYKKVRGASERMCKPLHIEDYISQPTDFVNPPKWHLGHTTWFFETFVLHQFYNHYRPFHPAFGLIFGTTDNQMGHVSPQNTRKDLSRPTVQEVYEYRAYVDHAMLKFLRNIPDDSSLIYLIELALHHEQQHQEYFFSDLKYTFANNPLFPAYSNKVYVEDIEVVHPQWLNIASGVYGVGHRGDGFHLKTETGRHKVYLQEFEIRNGLVSNAEYLEFVEDKAYENSSLWHAEGWKWIQDNQIKHPMYWMQKEDKWFQYTLAGVRLLNPMNPVSHVNFYEASAFARWKKLRLPTEFEWETVCDQIEYGHRWEWTESSFLPYPGYQENTIEVGEYKANLMVNHMVVRGGSMVSPIGHVAPTTRNFLLPHVGWSFTGIRLARG